MYQYLEPDPYSKYVSGPRRSLITENSDPVNLWLPQIRPISPDGIKVIKY